MNRLAAILSLVILTTACLPWEEGGRRHLVEAKCEGDYCVGMWEGSTEWSKVFKAEAVDGLEEVDASTLWPCEPEPDADICLKVDAQGHIGCFRFEDVDGYSYAVVVAPECAIDVDLSPLDWIDVGVGMMAALN